jgi:hypothetical protein
MENNGIFDDVFFLNTPTHPTGKRLNVFTLTRYSKCTLFVYRLRPLFRAHIAQASQLPHRHRTARKLVVWFRPHAPVTTARSKPSSPARDEIGMQLEVGAPSPARYLLGAAIMMAGVVLPLAYMIFRSKRSPSSAAAASAAGPSSFSKQT